MNNMTLQTEFNARTLASGGCDATIDVQWRVQQGGGAGDTRGEWNCVALNASGKCEKATLDIWPDVIAADPGGFELNARKTACHELGHSLGQSHHDPLYSDCLVRGAVTGTHQQYNSDHVGFINAIY